jgi:hypothetical protein
LVARSLFVGCLSKSSLPGAVVVTTKEAQHVGSNSVVAKCLDEEVNVARNPPLLP